MKTSISIIENRSYLDIFKTLKPPGSHSFSYEDVKVLRRILSENTLGKTYVTCQLEKDFLSPINVAIILTHYMVKYVSM